MLSERDYAERRDFIRMFVDATVSFRLPDSDTEYSGRSKNLSGSGLLFVSPVAIPLDQPVPFRLGSEQSKLPPLSGEFRAVRVQANDDGSFDIAAEMVQVV